MLMQTSAESWNWDNELPGKGLPTNDEINEWLFGRPPEQPKETPKMRVWLNGVVVTQPFESALQMQPFADWARSRLEYQVAPDECPPPGYTGVKHIIHESPYPPSMYIDDPDSYGIC